MLPGTTLEQMISSTKGQKNGKPIKFSAELTDQAARLTLLRRPGVRKLQRTA
jgi:hypothetical protein